jgi:alkylation response protein AidB-like acyl-CoA dehydrogenase
MAREFVIREVQPYVKDWDREGKTPKELYEKMGAQGLLGIKAPLEYGGLNLDWMTLGLVTEQFSYFDFSLGMGSCSRASLGILPFAQNGTEEQKRKYLSAMIPGKITHSFGAVEPNAGSNATAIETSAVLDNDEWDINGQCLD